MVEEENFFKVFKLVTGPGIETVRHIFDALFPPATLNATLNSHKYTTIIQGLKRKRIITAAQYALLFPPTGTGTTSVAFDLTLMICLIRNLTLIRPPTNGWDTLPPSTEISMEADIARIKFVRTLLAHTDRNVMSNSDFNAHWSCIYDAIQRQGGPGIKHKCDDIDKLRLIIISDVEIQDCIDQVQDFKQTLAHEFREEYNNEKSPTPYFLDTVSKHIGNDTLQLALELDLDISEIEQIKMESKNKLLEQTQKILSTWVAEEGRATNKNLVKALIRIGKRNSLRGVKL